eukprot:2730430-Pyramimonas_sp.AAC.2
MVPRASGGPCATLGSRSISGSFSGSDRRICFGCHDADSECARRLKACPTETRIAKTATRRTRLTGMSPVGELMPRADPETSQNVARRPKNLRYLSI